MQQQPALRGGALTTVRLGRVVISGPLYLVIGNFATIARIPIFIQNATANETFGTDRMRELTDRGAGRAGQYAQAHSRARTHATNQPERHQTKPTPTPTPIHKPPQRKTEPDDCGTLCYNATTRQKFWGFATAIGPVDDLRAGNDSRLNLIKQKGYKWL
jgi:hypothetical protein